VIKGKIFDIALDIRINSKTFGKYFSIELSEENHYMLYIPPGFPHDFKHWKILSFFISLLIMNMHQIMKDVFITL
jgi:dTDP-4-dehydrorhamnose 3,5-epimerase-like enzyme